MSLQDDASKACGLLRVLEGKDGELSAIKQTAQAALAMTVKACRGLVFQWSYKGGAIVGAEATTGFVLLHLGAGKWSAPVFLSSKSLSLGFTAGFSEISSVMALMTSTAADRFKQPSQGLFNIDFSLTIFPKDVRSGVSESFLDAVGDAVSFAVGKGLLADWSLKGGQLTADGTKNALVYGGPKEPEAILSSATPPEQLKELYEALAALEASA